MNPFRRRRTDRALIAKLSADNLRLNGQVAALRLALGDLGRQLHATNDGAPGDTVPLPRMRSLRVADDELYVQPLGRNAAAL